MSTQSISVWHAIEDTLALAENMKLRSSLMLALKEHIAHEGITQAEAAKKFGVTPPRLRHRQAAAPREPASHRPIGYFFLPEGFFTGTDGTGCSHSLMPPSIALLFAPRMTCGGRSVISLALPPPSST